MTKKKENTTALATTKEFNTALALANKEAEAPTLGKEYLPSIFLVTGNSALIREKKVEPDNYALSKGGDNIKDIGPHPEVVLLAHRARAQCEIDDEMVFIYDENHPFYSWIQKQADNATTDAARQNYKYGLDVLVWVSELKIFATIYFGRNPSNRRLARLSLADWVVNTTRLSVRFGVNSAAKGARKTTFSAPTLQATEKPLSEEFDPKVALAALKEFKEAPNKIPEEVEEALASAQQSQNQVVDGTIVR